MRCGSGQLALALVPALAYTTNYLLEFTGGNGFREADPRCGVVLTGRLPFLNWNSRAVVPINPKLSMLYLKREIYMWYSLMHRAGGDDVDVCHNVNL